MIPEIFIEHWRKTVKWQTLEQIEQDLIISRALVGEMVVYVQGKVFIFYLKIIIAVLRRFTNSPIAKDYL